MSEPHEAFVDPDEALKGAATLGSAGDRLGGRFRQLAARINRLNGGQPWGKDEPGETFKGQYKDKDDVIALGFAAVPLVEQLGPLVKGSVEGTVEVDDLVKALFGGGKPAAGS